MRGQGQGGLLALRVGEASHPGPISEDSFDLSADEAAFILDRQVMSLGSDGSGSGVDLAGTAPPALEEAAGASVAGFREALNALRRDGVPDNHTWSAVLVPLAWLFLPAYSRRLLGPALLTEGINIRPLPSGSANGS